MGNGEQSRKDIEARMKTEIREIGIPPRPAILNEVEIEITRDEPDFIRLAKIIGSDVGLAAGLIKTANAPYFALGKKVRTVPEAVLVFGLKTVVRTISGLALQQAFKHVPAMERFWDASATNARVSGWLGKRLGRERGVRAADSYTFSLFRDCGMPVLMTPFPEYRLVLAEANAEMTMPFTAVERRHLGLDHAEVGAGLAAEWRLPEDICQAIRFHHDRAVLAGETGGVLLPDNARLLIAIGQIAEYLIEQATGRTQTSEWVKLGPACMAIAGVDDAALAEMVGECQEAVAAV